VLTLALIWAKRLWIGGHPGPPAFPSAAADGEPDHSTWREMPQDERRDRFSFVIQSSANDTNVSPIRETYIFV
jgi:hypothetical protein